MKFVKLTRQGNGEPVWVNPGLVRYVLERDGETVLRFDNENAQSGDGAAMKVEEEAARVAEMLSVGLKEGYRDG